MRKVPVGLQMWTVREQAKANYVETLKRVAALGYEGVEQVHSLGYGGLSAKEVKATMDALGLQSTSNHVWLAQMETDLDAVMEFTHELGTKDLVMAWVKPEDRTNQADWERVVESLQHIAPRVKANGLTLHYHHHDFEFDVFSGTTVFDRLLHGLSPDQMLMQIDVYWAAKGKQVPTDLIQRLGDRCQLLHFKDMTADETRYFAEVGTGVIDFPAIASVAEHARWFIVEQDFCKGDSFESARTSITNLKKMGLA